MNDHQEKLSRSVTRLQPIAAAPMNEDAASMIELLQEHLKLARAGKLRSLAVVSVSADGSAIATQWSCAPGDTASPIGKLTVLTHDLMAARR
jgi:hypothetical protein